MPDEIDNYCSYTTTDYREHFGSWANALARANIEQPSGLKIPTESLRAELRRLADDLDTVPTGQDMVEHGHHGLQTYTNRFGSWNEALEAAGLSRRPDRKKRSDQELLAELTRLADELDQLPSGRDMDEHGAFSRITYRKHFGSWNEALEQAGFDRRRPKRQVPEEELIAELQQLAEDLDGRPTTDDMQSDGAFSPGTYINRFGSWNAALEAACLD
ncbi:hypothetical protein GCM10027355_36450 [Haloplanus salinarum]|uniref:homing endonuclease associated repeat-containing protein n=1 Tax=Haloplanus salinarum TaxID=1912324 RepID=UPI003B434BBF